MSDSPEKTAIRNTGQKALKTVLKQDKNIEIIEKYIHKKSKKSEDYEKTYKKIIYQIIGDIIKETDLKTIVKNIKKDLIDWNHPDFLAVKLRLDEHDDFIINPFEVEEGVTTCNCGSKRVFTYQRQVRSCDEPMTTFAKCVKCKKQWSYSG